MEQQVNLYQPIMGAEKHLFSARAIGIALAALMVSLGSLAAYAGWRNARLEHSLSSLEQQQAAELAMAQRANDSLRPTRSIAELESDARRLAAEIAERERALDVVKQGVVDPNSGFAARMEALAQAQAEGLWLRRILLAAGDGQLAFQGATVDTHLVPAYLAALSAGPAFRGVRLDRLSMQRAAAEDAPAVAIFEVAAPGLDFPREEHRP